MEGTLRCIQNLDFELGALGNLCECDQAVLVSLKNMLGSSVLLHVFDGLSILRIDELELHVVDTLLFAVLDSIAIGIVPDAYLQSAWHAVAKIDLRVLVASIQNEHIAEASIVQIGVAFLVLLAALILLSIDSSRRRVGYLNTEALFVGNIGETDESALVRFELLVSISTVLLVLYTCSLLIIVYEDKRHVYLEPPLDDDDDDDDEGYDYDDSESYYGETSYGEEDQHG